MAVYGRDPAYSYLDLFRLYGLSGDRQRRTSGCGGYLESSGGTKNYVRVRGSDLVPPQEHLYFEDIIGKPVLVPSGEAMNVTAQPSIDSLIIVYLPSDPKCKPATLSLALGEQVD